MSTFLKIIMNGSQSRTNQMNGIFLAIWGALSQSSFIQTNPQYIAILGGIQAILGIFQRSRKGHQPLTEKRTRLFGG